MDNVHTNVQDVKTAIQAVLNVLTLPEREAHVTVRILTTTTELK